MTVTITIPDDLVSPRTGCISQGPKFVGWAQINRSRWISVWCREIEIARVGSRSGAGRSKFGAFNFDPMTGDRNWGRSISIRCREIEIGGVQFRADAGRSKLDALDFDSMPADRNCARWISIRCQEIEIELLQFREGCIFLNSQ